MIICSTMTKTFLEIQKCSKYCNAFICHWNAVPPNFASLWRRHHHIETPVEIHLQVEMMWLALKGGRDSGANTLSVAKAVMRKLTVYCSRQHIECWSGEVIFVGKMNFPDTLKYQCLKTESLSIFYRDGKILGTVSCTMEAYLAQWRPTWPHPFSGTII